MIKEELKHDHLNAVKMITIDSNDDHHRLTAYPHLREVATIK